MKLIYGISKIFGAKLDVDSAWWITWKSSSNLLLVRIRLFSSSYHTGEDIFVYSSTDNHFGEQSFPVVFDGCLSFLENNGHLFTCSTNFRYSPSVIGIYWIASLKVKVNWHLPKAHTQNHVKNKSEVLTVRSRSYLQARKIFPQTVNK